MNEFGVSLRLRMMVYMVSRVKQVFGNVLEVWNKIWKVLG